MALAGDGGPVLVAVVDVFFCAISRGREDLQGEQVFLRAGLLPLVPERKTKRLGTTLATASFRVKRTPSPKKGRAHTLTLSMPSTSRHPNATCGSLLFP